MLTLRVGKEMSVESSVEHRPKAEDRKFRIALITEIRVNSYLVSFVI